jgi:hypothetical protein
MNLEKSLAQDELLFAAVGRLTVAWAHLEFGLDSMILLIHNTMDNAKHEPRLPRVLSRKIDYLRAAFKRLGIAEVDQPRYNAFLDEVRAQSVTRHDIIHGFPVYHPSDEGEAKLVRLTIGKSHWDQKEVTINIATVTEAWEDAYKLAGKALNWTRVMLQAYEDHLAREQ